MSLATSNRDGGRTNEAGHLRGVTKGFAGQVLTGLNVSQRGAGANMSVDVAIGDALVQRSDNTYGHPAWNDAVYNQVIATADGSNPRRDIIVMYIDYGQTPSTGVANNTNGVVKIKSVAGTAAGSPVDPSAATIQSSVGSGNPYVKLARVRVAAGATSISNSVIDDLRVLATSLPQGGWIYDPTYSWVYASATSFTVAGVDVTAQFPVGTRIALYQSGSIKYFVVSAVAFSTNTTVTIDGGGVYTLANVPIDRAAYSYLLRPSGYPLSAINEPGLWYQELARTTLTGNNATITVSNIPVRKHLRIIVIMLPNGAVNGRYTFNNDAGSNYAQRFITDYSTPSDLVSQAFIEAEGGNGTRRQYMVIDLMNVLNQTKLGIETLVHDNGTNAASTVPAKFDSMIKYNSNNQVTRFDINTTTNTWAAGSEVVVLGHD